MTIRPAAPKDLSTLLELFESAKAFMARTGNPNHPGLPQVYDILQIGREVYTVMDYVEGRGFDETGEKGFILLDTAARSMQFIPFARRTIRESDADIGGCSGAYEAYERIRRMYPPEREAIVRFNLRGNLDFRDARLAEEIKSYLSDAYYFVDVRDKTSVRANVAADAAETTLKGQFCRSVLSDPSLSDEDKARVIDVGLNALSGKEGEI